MITCLDHCTHLRGTTWAVRPLDDLGGPAQALRSRTKPPKMYERPYAAKEIASARPWDGLLRGSDDEMTFNLARKPV